VAAARADRKTEIARFLPALGLKAGANVPLPLVRRLAQRVEDDIRPYVRAAKDRFHRLRPYEIEPRIEPCIDHLPGDAAYPSGHSTYGYVITGVLVDLAPERRAQLEARGAEFAHQRMVCGVHFASDIEAGRLGAIWLMKELHSSPNYRADAAAAAAELQVAMRAN
jgi:acid phosphatase (class A)